MGRSPITLGVFAAVLGGVANAGPAGSVAHSPSLPEVALLSTPSQGSTTSLRFQRLGAPEPAGAVAALAHLRGAVVLGEVVPSTRAVVVIADRAPGRDRSFGSSLFRLEEGKPSVELADRVYYATRPLVTRAGRVFVQRGRPGEEPVPQGRRTDRLRTDRLTIDEVNPWTGDSRVVHRFDGYLAFLAGTFENEVFIYRVGYRQADLVAVDMDHGHTRPLQRSLLPMARDFAVDAESGSLFYTTQSEVDPERWSVERVSSRTGTREVLLSGDEPSFFPFPLRKGRLALNLRDPPGLAVLGDTRIDHPFGSGIDRVRCVSADGSVAVVFHSVAPGPGLPYALELETGRRLGVATAVGEQVDVAGFVSSGAK